MPLVSFAQIRLDNKGDKLKGYIKKMTEYQFSLFADSNRNRIPDQTAIYTYNEETKEEIVYYYWGSDSLKWTYKDIFVYDENNLIEHRHLSKTDGHGGYIEKDSVCSFVTYKYDKSDRLTEVRTSQSGISFRTVYTHNQK